MFSAVEVESHEAEAELPITTIPDASSAATEEPAAVEPAVSFNDFDLAAELETSFAAPAVESLPEMKRKGGFTPSFRMPLANFQSGAGVVSQYSPEPKAVPSAIEPAAPSMEPPAITAPASTLPAMDVLKDIPLAGPAESVQPVDGVHAEVKAGGRFTELDALFYDVDRYSAPAHSSAGDWCRCTVDRAGRRCCCRKAAGSRSDCACG